MLNVHFCVASKSYVWWDSLFFLELETLAFHVPFRMQL